MLGPESDWDELGVEQQAQAVGNWRYHLQKGGNVYTGAEKKGYERVLKQVGFFE